MKETHSKKDGKQFEEMKLKDVNLNTYKSSDWFFQIALMIAVTLLVITCIVGAGMRNSVYRDQQRVPYEFPMHRFQTSQSKNTPWPNAELFYQSV